MGILRMQEVQAGMVLAADVVDRTGRVLARAGTELTDRHLRILKIWGVSEVDAEGVADGEAPGGPPAETGPPPEAAAEEEARKLFVHTDLTHPAVQELLRLCALRIVTRDGREDVNHGS